MDEMSLSTKQLSEYLDFAKNLAINAGEIMIKNEDLLPPFASGHTYINEHVAYLIEKYIIAEIASNYPGHALFRGVDTNKEFEWICDYIDGAYAYSRKHRISVTSIALTYKGTTVVAAVYNPWENILYHATIGHGFFVNDELFSNDATENYQGSLVDVEWWKNASYDVDTFLHNFSIKKDVYVLHVGSVIHAACLVANGTFAAAVLGKFMSGKNHEIAAISLLINEAGCLLTDLYGKVVTNTGDIKGLVFANKSIHADLIKEYSIFDKL